MQAEFFLVPDFLCFNMIRNKSFSQLSLTRMLYGSLFILFYCLYYLFLLERIEVFSVGEATIEKTEGKCMVNKSELSFKSRVVFKAMTIYFTALAS